MNKPKVPDLKSKVNASYRLPRKLVEEVSHEAVRLHVRPCVVVEAALTAALASAAGSLSRSQ